MKLSLFAILCLLYVNSSAQKVNPIYPQVRVTDWNQKAYAVAPQFWEDTGQEMQQKVGQETFDKIKKYADNENMPDAFIQFDGHRLLSSLKTYTERLASLKVYQVVEVHDVNYAGDFGMYTILAVPKQELYWDKTANWDTVYFVISSKFVEPYNIPVK